MITETKKEENKLTDEQMDEAVGGFGQAGYRCGGSCGRYYSGAAPFYVGNTPYCANCYFERHSKEMSRGERE